METKKMRIPVNQKREKELRQIADKYETGTRAGTIDKLIKGYFQTQKLVEAQTRKIKEQDEINLLNSKHLKEQDDIDKLNSTGIWHFYK